MWDLVTPKERRHLHSKQDKIHSRTYWKISFGLFQTHVTYQSDHYSSKTASTCHTATDASRFTSINAVSISRSISSKRSPTQSDPTFELHQVMKKYSSFRHYSHTRGIYIDVVDTCVILTLSVGDESDHDYSVYTSSWSVLLKVEHTYFLVDRGVINTLNQE